MGCDIHAFAERKTPGGYERINADFADGLDPFNWRNYGVFGFLAGVRNYSDVTPISDPRGLPKDVSAEVLEEYADTCGHSSSWLSVQELLQFDYGQKIEDKRVTVQLGPNHWTGAATCETGQGEMMTWREFLGASFFQDLDTLKVIGADRVVFWFDS